MSAASLRSEPSYDLLRVLSVYSIYHGKEIIEKSDTDPIPALCDLFDCNTTFLKKGTGAIPMRNSYGFRKK